MEGGSRSCIGRLRDPENPFSRREKELTPARELREVTGRDQGGLWACSGRSVVVQWAYNPPTPFVLRKKTRGQA